MHRSGKFPLKLPMLLQRVTRTQVKLSGVISCNILKLLFSLNDATLSADFTSSGEWQGSEREMEFDDLPNDVKDGFNKSKYSDWDQKSVFEVQEQSKPLKYKIGVAKSGLQKKNLFFDADGKLLKENITL